MIDIKFLRENPEVVKQNIRNKFQDKKVELVDQVIELDAESRKVKGEADSLRASRNKVSKQIGMFMAQGKKDEAEEAKKLVANDVKYYIEVANMPTTNDALEYLKENVKVVAPSKAVNAGGVAVSALEMGQNSMRYNWTAEEVDARLQQIMKDIHDHSAAAAEKYGLGYDLVAGANIAGFVKVADAMMAQGII